MQQVEEMFFAEIYLGLSLERGLPASYHVGPEDLSMLRRDERSFVVQTVTIPRLALPLGPWQAVTETVTMPV